MMGVLNMMKAISRIREGETWQVGENMAGASPVTTIYGTGMWSRLTMFSTIRGYLAGQGAGITGQVQGGRHDRGKPCHYYIRNVYRFALGCIFHELTNIITVLLLLAATCLPRSIVVTGLAPVMFARPHHAHLPPSCPTPLSCFVLPLSYCHTSLSCFSMPHQASSPHPFQHTKLHSSLSTSTRNI